jgi:hypothetical protein
LEKLGFPWILSPESSLFNGLHGIFAGEKFARPFARRQRAKAEAMGVEVREGKIAHGPSVTQLLFFRNYLLLNLALMRRCQ